MEESVSSDSNPTSGYPVNSLDCSIILKRIVKAVYGYRIDLAQDKVQWRAAVNRTIYI